MGVAPCGIRERQEPAGVCSISGFFFLLGLCPALRVLPQRFLLCLIPPQRPLLLLGRAGRGRLLLRFARSIGRSLLVGDVGVGPTIAAHGYCPPVSVPRPVVPL